jgi:hypothetical protein
VHTVLILNFLYNIFIHRDVVCILLVFWKRADDLYHYLNIYVIYYYYWVDTSAGGLQVPEGIIRPVVGASALTWFIRYIYYWNLQFLNNLIINKTKVLLPQAEVILAEFGYPV